MGRPSNLSEAKWEELGRRLINGEKAADLAREYRVSRSAISKRFSKQTETVKEVAHQIVSAEEALARLPVSQQINAVNLAQQLRSISQHLAVAATYGAATAHRLTALANSEVQKIDDAEPLKSFDSLKGVAALSKLANESAAIGLNLLAANKERVNQMSDEASDDAPMPTDPIDAAQAYMKLMGG